MYIYVEYSIWFPIALCKNLYNVTYNSGTTWVIFAQGIYPFMGKIMFRHQSVTPEPSPDETLPRHKLLRSFWIEIQTLRGTQVAVWAGWASPRYTKKIQKQSEVKRDTRGYNYISNHINLDLFKSRETEGD